LSLFAFFGENSPFLKKLKEFTPSFVCLLEAQQHTHFSLLTCAVAGCVHHQAMT
jgi:hypothetical protein